MKQRWRFALLILLVTAATSALAYWRVLLPVDRLLYDKVVNAQPTSTPDDIIIVGIDETSLRTLGRWPWPRRNHAMLLDELKAANAKAVLLDIIFTDRDESRREDDRLLAQSIASFNHVGLPMVIEAVFNQGQLVERLPLPEFSRATPILGHVHVERDSDGVCRSVFLQEGLNTPHWSHLSVSLLEQLNQPMQSLPGLRSQVGSAGPMTVARDYFNLIRFAGAGGTIPQVSYIDILERRIDPSIIENKILFVGMTALGLGDTFVTPAGTMSGVELNANIFHALRSNQFILPTSLFWNVLVSSIVACALISVLGLLSPRWFLAGTLLGMVGVLFVAYLGIVVFDIWFAPASILAALVLFYPLWNWQRLERALFYLKAELKNIGADTPTKPTQKELNQYIHSLSIAEQLFPTLNWAVYEQQSEPGVNTKPLASSELFGKNSLSINTDDQSSQVFQKNVHLGSKQYRFDIFQNEGVDENLIRFMDRSVFSQGERQRKKMAHGVEVVEKTVLALGRAQKLSAQNQQIARQSVKHLPEAILLTNHIGQVNYANSRATQIFHQYDLDQTNIVELFKTVSAKESVVPRQCIADLVLTGKEFTFEGECENKFYVFRGLQVRLPQQPQTDQNRPDDNNVLLFYFNDITELKENERARLDTLHFLSHDLRSPMTSVLALIETAKHSNQQNQAEVLNQVKAYTEQSLNFAQQFIQLAKAEEIKRQDFYPCDIQDIIDNAADQIYPTAKAKKVDLEVLSVNEIVLVDGDGDLLERVFINLLSNAVKYSPRQSKIRVELNQFNQSVVQIAISDEGEGIKEKDLPLVFERFKKGSSDGPAGVGLGLYFVKVVCERHGGSVVANNNDKGGATFTVKLPLNSSEK